MTEKPACTHREASWRLDVRKAEQDLAALRVRGPYAGVSLSSTTPMPIREWCGDCQSYLVAGVL